ncbi:dTDP-4-dehydrorhamnose 3,5-epimerase [candidate division KSB1 bacterium]|nr:dTDP-4-dehydrorhamnose 3,5-epimerase [candidate division KSB1 bacterium]
MKFITTDIKDVLIIQPAVYGDERGFFMETFNAQKFAKAGLDLKFVQDNLSRSKKGTLRGLHYQLYPHAQGKLVRVTCGAVFDVAVDLRKNSSTFGRWTGVELSEENKHALYVPPGFAHGFYVLSDIADFVYKCTALYAPAAERGILWNDPQIGIQWPLAGTEPKLSKKDNALPPLKSAEMNF